MLNSSQVQSFVLSQIFGLYLIIMGILLYSRVDYFRQLVRNLKPHDSIIFLAASMGLFFGLCLVNFHNVWEFKPRVVITLICWYVLIKSLVWLAMPEEVLAYTQKIFAGSRYYWFTGTVMAVGVVLVGRGFVLYLTRHGMV